jgi:DMSO/TMAO reductase YedYZ molybdopterin-dependent catalytic subunit
MVTQPTSYSMSDLKRLPVRSQITEVVCEEGWSYIAEWIGTPLSEVLKACGLLDGALYVAYFPFDPVDREKSWESIDIHEALHPQTLVTYGMNDRNLPVPFGGPLRLRLPRQIGYKSVKFISRVTVTNSLKNLGKGLGSAAPETGYAWYAGI